MGAWNNHPVRMRATRNEQAHSRQSYMQCLDLARQVQHLWDTLISRAKN